MGPVAFQGELGAYSELASREFFGYDIDVSPTQTFREVFEKVQSGNAEAGMIPIENSLAGSVHENYDLFLDHDLVIVGEIKLRIVHHLIVNSGVAIEDVRSVMSHPQALAQCKDFIDTLPSAHAVPVYDTAGAVRDLMSSGAKDAAAIGSAQAAANYAMPILESGIESNHQNFTRFLVVKPRSSAPDVPHRGPHAASEPDAAKAKVTVVFALHNEPGVLFKSLAVFALRDIDLLKIESRPLHGQPWEYLFYLDFSGDVADAKCRKALEHMGEITTLLRVLGSYEEGKVVDGSPTASHPASGEAPR